MNKRRQLVLLLMLLAIIEPALAQSPGSRDVFKPGEQKNAEDEREGKALELMAEIIKDARALRSPENRIRLLATAGETLWNHDEKKARALIEEAARGLARSWPVLILPILGSMSLATGYLSCASRFFKLLPGSTLSLLWTS